jgi:hypothetical protein
VPVAPTAFHCALAKKSTLKRKEDILSHKNVAQRATFLCEKNSTTLPQAVCVSSDEALSLIVHRVTYVM